MRISAGIKRKFQKFSTEVVARHWRELYSGSFSNLRVDKMELEWLWGGRAKSFDSMRTENFCLPAVFMLATSGK